MRTIASVCVGLALGSVVMAQSGSQPPVNPRRPIVLVTGCARATPKPHLWQLSKASSRTETNNPGITNDEVEELKKRAGTNANYELIGVADFVAPETSREIGLRKELIPPARVNTTSTLAAGRRVAVKGMLLPATPPRINLTSVIDLGTTCS